MMVLKELLIVVMIMKLILHHFHMKVKYTKEIYESINKKRISN